MFDFNNIGLEYPNWGEMDRSYLGERSSHEIEVVETEAARAVILETGLLHYARNRKVLGRVLVAAAPDRRLLPNDRLEPGPELMNAADFETRAVPFRCKFPGPRSGARGRNASWMLRRNPLIAIELGTTPQTTLHLDTLRTLYVGAFGTFVLHVLFALIDANAYAIIGPIEVVRAETRKRVFSDYNSLAKRDGSDPSYQSFRLAPQMVQGSKRLELKTKAAETGALLRWETHFCFRPGGLDFPRRGARAAAGASLLDCVAIPRNTG